jgi:hypothetical protein
MNQADLFPDLPSVANPSGEFAKFRVGEKIIQIPISFWKDGTKKIDLTEHGGPVVRSKIHALADQKAIEELRRIFESRDEVVREHDERAIEFVQKLLAPDRAKRPVRLRKKDLTESAPELVFANPFTEDKSQFFGKYPDWLLQRRDLKWAEKMIYGRLLFPLPPICRSFDKNLGVIIGLDQGKLAEALGTNRTTVNQLLISLQAKAWLKCDGPPGAKQTTRFLWKDGMPETCRNVQQVLAGRPVAESNSSCRTSQQQPVAESNSSCRTSQQVTLAVETSRETKRSKRRVIAPGGEQILLDEIRAIAGDTEVRNNGGMWVKRIRHCAKAVRYMIEDWKLRTPDQRRAIKNIGAWLTDRYRRALLEIDRARKASVAAHEKSSAGDA